MRLILLPSRFFVHSKATTFALLKNVNGISYFLHINIGSFNAYECFKKKIVHNEAMADLGPNFKWVKPWKKNIKVSIVRFKPGFRGVTKSILPAELDEFHCSLIQNTYLFSFKGCHVTPHLLTWVRHCSEATTFALF